jgi:hypothetical protein
MEQLFDYEPGLTDRSIRKGDALGVIGSFVLDYGKGFTRAGVSRLNDSIRTFVWAILGAQSQARSTILGSGRAFDAQKQFLANVEDVINSEVDLPSSIKRYQDTLKYARSKVDFVLGFGLYMIPSNMDLKIGNFVGYNNLIVIAGNDLKIGFNENVNSEEVKSNVDFDSITTDNFDLVETKLPTDITIKDISSASFDLPITDDLPVITDNLPLEENFSHEENKLLLTLIGFSGGLALIWFLK